MLKNRVTIFTLLLWGCVAWVSLPFAAAYSEVGLTKTEQITVQVLKDLPYKSGEGITKYEAERCKLDIYLPVGKKDFPVVVWFHGGGLTGGDKVKETAPVAQYWAEQGIAVVSANYRLSPRVSFPAYLQDGAAAVKWAKENMTQHGGNVQRLFIGGHSAGAYMALMIGLDGQYLQKVVMSTKDLAGLVPVSGQTMTHFTVRGERGLDKNKVIADEAAPVHFAGKNTPPMLLLMGDQDWPARLEENAYFAALCRVAGNNGVHLLTVKDRNHGSIFSKLKYPQDQGARAVLKFIDSPQSFRLESSTP